MSGSKTFAIILVPGILLTGIAGVAAGVRFRDDILRLLVGKPIATTTGPSENHLQKEKIAYYTCSMDPQIRRQEPGPCPICKMPLSPVYAHDHTEGVLISASMVQNMAIRTTAVEQGELRQTIRAVGTLTEPEQNHLDINLRVSGWIQKLYANQEGMVVQKGDPLFELYSPEITAAADELISARKAYESMVQDPVLVKSTQAVMAAGRRKLELLGLTSDQIEAIASADHAPPTITIAAPIHGHIAEKMIIEGSAVKPGEPLMKIADRSSMWLQLQVFEQQLGLIATGQKVQVAITAVPGKTYEGTVDFVYPHLDTATRTALVRVVLPNTDHRLHENMYATAEIDAGSTSESLLVPREAIIDSGLRQIVFVQEHDQPGHFVPRQVTLGRTGRRSQSGPEVVQILSGLSPEDTVVTSGQFLLDSESRLQESSQKFDAVDQPAKPPVQDVAADDRVDALVKAYLPIAAFLGAPQKDASAADVAALLRAAEDLSKSADASQKKAGEEILAAARALDHQPIDKQRPLFKPLSKAVVDLAHQHTLSPAFGKVYAFRCTRDDSVWLQQTPTPANPYFPIEMKTCGEVTDSLGADSKGAEK